MCRAERNAGMGTRGAQATEERTAWSVSGRSFVSPGFRFGSSADTSDDRAYCRQISMTLNTTSQSADLRSVKNTKAVARNGEGLRVFKIRSAQCLTPIAVRSGTYASALIHPKHSTMVFGW
jgi:hypothetical protein